MQRWAYLLVVLASVCVVITISGSPADTASYDPPHNATNSIHCGNCHGRTLTVDSPFWSGTSADSAYNAICLRCHNGTNAPLANAHSPGGTAIRCTTCHSNHEQEQVLAGKYNQANFFIVTGTANRSGSPPSYNADTNETTITVISISASNPSSDWAANLNLLADKTATGRGAMFVPSRSYRGRWPIFTIKSISVTPQTGDSDTGTDDGTIVVKGDATAADDFGVFYGQQMRSIIWTDDVTYKIIEFFDNRGPYGFVDPSNGDGLCQICHTSTTHFQSTLDGGDDNHNTDSDCTLCHGHNDVSNGGFAASADHTTDGMVAYTSGSCDLCHMGDAISGIDTHGGDCDLCHVSAESNRLRTVAEIVVGGARANLVTTMPTGGTLGGSDGGGTCDVCHATHASDWYFHEVDHVAMGWVTSNTDTSSVTLNCIGCHDQSSILTGVHYLGDSGSFEADVCNDCHTSASSTKVLKNSASGQGNTTPDHEDHSIDPPNECVSCHDTHFDGHSHTHTTAYDAGLDISQIGGINNECADCHDDASNGLATFDDIRFEHDIWTTQDASGGCTTCHDYASLGNKTGDPDTPLLATVQSVISTGGASTCVSCHVKKSFADSPATAEHGSHEENHFGWDGGCVDCHATANNYVVQEVHSNTCTVCHTITAGNRNNEKVGDSSNGIDGDATLADGTAAAATWSTPKCLTCHPDATYNRPFMHHDRATTEPDNCTGNCHNSSTGHAGNHTATVAIAANCADCHDSAKGSTDNVPVGSGDNKLHDQCSACHAYAGASTGTMELIDPASSGLVTAMPDGGDAGGTNGGGNCETCHTAGFTGFHQAVDHSDTVVTYVNCSVCHSATGSTTDSGDPKVHDSCAACHGSADGRLIDPGTSSLVDAMPNGTGHGGTDGGGNCSACHNEYFDSHTSIDHTGFVALASNCTDCHNSTKGSATTVPTGSGDNRLHDACSTCHKTTGVLTGASGYAQTMPANGGDCEACHTSGFTGYHQSVSHADTVQAYANCSTCHAATGSNTDSGDPKVHDTCSGCHDADGSLTGSASGKDNSTAGGTDGGGNCSVCHGEYFASHTNIDHSTSVDIAAGTGADIDCVDCHSGTEGTTTTVPLDASSPAGDKKHDTCSACHENDGDLTGSAAGKDGGEAGGTNGGGDCETCHGSYFDSHSHSHTTDYDAALDRSQESDDPSTACAQCHDDAGNSFVSFDDIRYEHDIVDGSKDGSGGCTTCHDYTTNGNLTGDPDTPLLATVRSVITAGGASTCVSCHVRKEHTVASSAHGGHETGHFGWDGDCVDCHATANDYVVQEVHGDTCTMCHASMAGTRDNEKLGDATNGVDGDARLANGTAAGGTWSTPKCLTCHPDATCSKPHIHHDRATFGPDNCTTSCHNISTGHAGNHTATVAIATNCGNCHDATKGSSDNVPLNSADAKLHDTCGACHEMTAANTAVLKSPYGAAQAMPDGSTDGGTDGGGDCEACHTSGFTGYHQSVDHSDTVQTYANCSTCHTATGSTTDSGDPKVHDTCSGCHDADGTLTGSASGKDNSTAGGTDGGGNCSLCHGEYFVSHTSIDHSTSVDIASNTGSDIDCIDCHSGTEGTGSTVPLNSGNAKVHDACSACHENDGGLTGSATGKDGGEAGGTNGGGVCETCHTGYFNAHMHSHGATYDSAVDRSQETDNAANACAECHRDKTSDNTSLDTWEGIRYEHDVSDGSQDLSGGCTTCHDYTTNGNQTGDPDTPLLTTVRSVIGAGGTPTCVACHVRKEHTVASSNHGTVDHTALGYVTFMGTVPGCDTCHIPGTIDATIGVHNTCQSCHTSSPPALRTDVASMQYVTSNSAGGGDCETCHHGHDMAEEAGVDTAQHPPQMCGECHGGLDRSFTDYAELKMHHYNDCGTCHDSTRDINDPNDGTGFTPADYTVADVIANSGIVGATGVPDDTTSPTNCTNCHRGRMGLDHTGHPRVKAGIRGSRYSDDAVGQQTLQCFTAGCHAENTAEEHLTPRGIAYKNFNTKYSSAFDCEFCHQYKYPIGRVKAVDGCSDPAYTDQSSCEAGTPTWSTIVGECSDPAYTDQTSCEAGTPTWGELTFNDDPVIQTAIANGARGNDVYCSDCHKEDVGRHDFGECSDGTTQNEVECIYECDNPSYTTQVDCVANGANWDVATGETWTDTGFCSNSAYDNQTDCENNSGTWTVAVPYSMHDKYNGLGIYSFSDMHHQAEIWNGSCSNAGITDEDACYADGSTWTPTYSSGVTYVGNGDCTACHLDPREVNSLPAPRKLPCTVCHISSSANTVSVYRDRTYTQDALSETAYTGWSWSFTGPMANSVPYDVFSCTDWQYDNQTDCENNGETWSKACSDNTSTDQATCEGAGETWRGVQHEWSVSGGELQSYGVCVFCHKMRPYHAKTDPSASGITFIADADSTDNDCSDGSCDIEHFPGVGRNGLDTFFSIWRAPVKHYVNIGAGAPSTNQTKKDLAKVPEVDAIPKASTIFWSMVTYDPATDPFGQVPGDHTMGTPEYFTIPVFDVPPYTDTVTINTTNSTYVPATPSLTIEATCSGTCTEVYCVFGGQEFLMGTGAGTHTKTLTSADGVQNIQPKGNPGFTVDTIVGRVYVISVDSSGNTTDQAAIDFKGNSVKTAISYP